MMVNQCPVTPLSLEITVSITVETSDILTILTGTIREEISGHQERTSLLREGNRPGEGEVRYMRGEKVIISDIV